MTEDAGKPDSGAAKAAQAAGTAARGTARGVAATARGVGRFSRFTFRQARRAASAQGAEASGLSRLIEMHAFNTAGDAAVAISLAGSLFFQVPGSGGSSSRESVALFLGLTMLPFAIVAPLLGPFLDRVAHGRRWAIGAVMAVRAFLCWVLAGALAKESPAMFPAALGVLVASKAYGVTKAAAVPRLLPEGVTLVKANGRVAMAGIVGVCASAPIAGLASMVGPQWVLRWAFLLFVVATVLAIRLPASVDSNVGEGTLAFRREGKPATGTLRMPMPATVAYALRANCAPKFLYGFLLMFFAFLLQAHPLHDWSPTLLIAIVAGAAGTGNFLGVAAASVVRNIRPAMTVSAVMVLDTAVALLAALFYSVPLVALLGLVTGLGASLAKFSLDSSIQAHIPPSVQTSAFARSDTTLQLAWVIGGFVGIALPLNARLGLFVTAAVLGAWTFYVLMSRPGRRTA
ncbi:MFS transporter [Nocardioides sp. Kera G14]|uniref:MFS transporter n=1 Tax=Nocardioides sp. Kera G14 TaxID=2884264 RepID=UPI001D10C3D9|nr:MFS transporter [Nocardioides sp. Kera G14]UDY24227.1 MFS transporter [Nocardioides sp. Kera G14]